MLRYNRIGAVIKECLVCVALFGAEPGRQARSLYCSKKCMQMSPRRRSLIRQSRLGKIMPNNIRLKVSRAKKGRGLGRVVPESIRRKISEAQKGVRSYWFGKVGALASRWAGGVGKKYQRLRMSKEYKLWRTQVLEKCDWTCQVCLVRGGKLEAHHIKEFASYPDLRFVLENGITLCKACHKQTHARKAA